MLEEALSQIGEYLPIAIEYLINVVIIFLVGYGAVLLVGRMLGIVKSYKVKNSIASIVMFSFCIYYMQSLYFFDETRFFIIEIVTHFSGSIILYVLVGFNLVKRVNELLDQTIVDVDANDSADDIHNKSIAKTKKKK